MATWTRLGTGTAPTATNADLIGSYALDTATAPGDFDPAAVTSIRSQWTITGSGFIDDSWDNVAGVSVVTGATELSQHPAEGSTANQNLARSSDHTDSTGIPTGLTTAQWEAAAVRGDGTLDAWCLWNKVKGADGSTLTVSVLTVTITYTPSSSDVPLDATGGAAGSGNAEFAATRPLTAAGSAAAGGTAELAAGRALDAAGSGSAGGAIADLQVIKSLVAAGGAAAAGLAESDINRGITATGSAADGGQAEASGSVIDTAVLLLQAKEYSGSGNWLDLSGNGHDATPVASPAFTSAGADSFFTLNGTTQYFYVANHADLNFALADSFTVMIWASKTDVTPVAVEYLVNKSTTGFIGWELTNTTTDIRFSLFGSPGSAAAAPAASDGVPFVLAGVRDTGADDLRAFLDGTGGTAPTDGSTVSLSNTQDLAIGARKATTPDRFMAGDVYAVALWRSALSDADVATAGTELTASSSTPVGLDAVGGGAAGGNSELAAARPIAGTGSSAAGGLAELAASRPITATGSGAADGTTDVSVAVVLAATGSAAASGTASVQSGISATGSAAASGQAEIAAQRPLTATGGGAGAGTSQLGRGVPFAGSGANAATGTVEVSTDVPITATGSAAAGSLAETDIDRGITGTGNAAEAAQAEVTVAAGGGAVAIDGTGSGAATGTGAVSVAVDLGATGSGAASGTSTLGADRPIDGTGSSAAAAIGDVTPVRNLTSTGGAAVGGQAAISLVSGLAASGPHSAAGQAELVYDAALAGSGSGAAGATAEVGILGAVFWEHDPPPWTRSPVPFTYRKAGGPPA